MNFNHTDSHGQPLTFADATAQSSPPPAPPARRSPAPCPIADRTNNPWYILGTGTEYRTLQDHAKIKLAYDISPTLRASYMLGVWQNESDGRPRAYLRDAAGNAVYSGTVNIGGRSFTALSPGGRRLHPHRRNLTHLMHGLSLKSHTRGRWDWEVAASLYDYGRDLQRQNAAANRCLAPRWAAPARWPIGSGTGWTNLALKGIWRPQAQGAHIVDFGVQQDNYQLHYLTTNIAGNWLTDPAGAREPVGGKTAADQRLRAGCLGLRPRGRPCWAARRALAGRRAAYQFSAHQQPDAPIAQPHYLSPKAALSYQAASDLVLKASAGRAVRMPTVNELYGATSTTNSQFINDPNLRPEKSWTTELTAEKDVAARPAAPDVVRREHARFAVFADHLRRRGNRNITRVQNVGRIETNGLEVAFNGTTSPQGAGPQGSLTYADSLIKENGGFVVTPGDTLGKCQPSIPIWRATALASYRFDEHWTAMACATAARSTAR